jgi:hypothetical protein
MAEDGGEEGLIMTAQIHERLIFEGEETSMAFCPPLPEGHPRVREVGADEPTPEGTHPWIASTACWRGYQGTWEVRDGRFYLVALEGRYRLEGEGPLFADWFTGALRVPRGELLQYVHMGFGSVYEEEAHVRIKDGIVVALRVIDNRGKTHDRTELGWQNLPGGENRFPGDSET